MNLCKGDSDNANCIWWYLCSSQYQASYESFSKYPSMQSRQSHPLQSHSSQVGREETWTQLSKNLNPLLLPHSCIKWAQTSYCGLNLLCTIIFERYLFLKENYCMGGRRGRGSNQKSHFVRGFMKTLEMEIPCQDSFLQFKKAGSAEVASFWWCSVVPMSIFPLSIASLPWQESIIN